MALRMLRYVVRQLEHWRKERPGIQLLPVIIPLVMYHGPEGAWTAPRRVEELFDLPGEGHQPEQWRALVPRFEYLVDDLTAERAEVLMARPGPPLARLALLVLAYGRSEELAQRLPGWMALFNEVHAAPEGAEELSMVVHYLLLIGDPPARSTAVGMLKSVVGPRRAEELMLNWGEEHFEQGREKGRAEGRAEGQAQAVLRLLTLRGFLIDAQARQRISSCTDLTLIDQWLERALKATTLAEVLGDLTQ